MFDWKLTRFLHSLIGLTSTGDTTSCSIRMSLTVTTSCPGTDFWFSVFTIRIYNFLVQGWLKKQILRFDSYAFYVWMWNGFTLHHRYLFNVGFDKYFKNLFRGRTHFMRSSATFFFFPNVSLIIFHITFSLLTLENLFL